MAKINIVVTKYHFRKPLMLTEEQFLALKHTFSQQAYFDTTPKSGFWDEFEIFKWLLIVFIIGVGLTLAWPQMIFVAGLSGVALIGAVVSGTLNSMNHYNNYLVERDAYYTWLNKTIKRCDEYGAFVFAFYDSPYTSV